MKYFGYICEECQTGHVRDKKIKNYEIDFYQDKFIISYAIVGECDKCGAINYAGEELHRWEQEYKKWQTKSKLYLAPEKITEVRDYLKMKQKEFADFLGVSRQSLSVWEKPDRPSVQPKNVDIILRIIHSEISQVDQPTIQKMMAFYKTGEIINRKEPVIKDDILRKILPNSTYEIMNRIAKDNNSTPFTELVNRIETEFILEDYTGPFWKSILEADPSNYEEGNFGLKDSIKASYNLDDSCIEGRYEYN